MDIQDEEHISQFVTQSTNNAITTQTKTKKTKTSLPEPEDDIEEFMMASRVDQNVQSTKKRDYKDDYTQTSLKLLEHDRQLHNLEQHTKNKTVPYGLIVNLRSSANLETDLKKEWNATLHSCSETLLQILIKHHKKAKETYAMQRNALKKHISDSELKIINKGVIEQHNASTHSRKRKYEERENERNNHKKIREQNKPNQKNSQTHLSKPKR